MTAALEGVSGQQHTPAALYPSGKTRYPFYRRLGGPQGRSGRAENLVPTGIRSRTFQPLSSVAIPTELPGPQSCQYLTCYLSICFKILRNPTGIAEYSKSWPRIELGTPVEQISSENCSAKFLHFGNSSTRPKKLISLITSLVLNILFASNDTGNGGHAHNAKENSWQHGSTSSRSFAVSCDL